MAQHSLNRISIDGFRGLRNLDMDGLGALNILVGGNSSGKTSVLEAVSILCNPCHPYEWLAMVRRRDFGGLDETRVQSLRWCFRQTGQLVDPEFMFDGRCAMTCTGKFPLRKLTVEYKDIVGEPSAKEVERMNRYRRDSRASLELEEEWRGSEITHYVEFDPEASDGDLVPSGATSTNEPIVIQLWEEGPMVGRPQLRQRVQNHLDAAYGLDALMQGSLDTAHDLDLNEHYVSLLPGFTPQPPVSANLAGGMQHLLSQALTHEFPAAPHFEAEVKSGSLKKVYELVFPATQVPDGRLPIDKPLRPIVRQIAVPLWLGDMGIDATHFVLGQHWKTHFSRKVSDTGSPMSVGQLRRWIDDPKPMGLPKDAQNLVILIYAAQTNQTLYLHGAPYEATLSNVPDACELRKDKLPDEADWERALSRAGSLFGVAGSRLLSGGNVNSLAAGCKQKAAEVRKACQAYAERLKQRMTELGMTPDATDRMQTAAATLRIVDQLSTAEQGAVIGLLAKATIATSETAMRECVGKAAELEGNLDTAGWQTFELIRKLPDEHQATVQAILTDLQESLGKDEHVVELAPVLKSTQAQAMRLLEKAVEKRPVAPPSDTPPHVTPPPMQPPATPPPPPGWVLIDEGNADGLDLSQAKDKLAELESSLRADRRIHVQIRWRVEEKKG